jgi:hypothetical protein
LGHYATVGEMACVIVSVERGNTMKEIKNKLLTYIDNSWGRCEKKRRTFHAPTVYVGLNNPNSNTSHGHRIPEHQ